MSDWVRYECQQCGEPWAWDELRQVQPAGDYHCPVCDGGDGGLFRLLLHRPDDYAESVMAGLRALAVLWATCRTRRGTTRTLATSRRVRCFGALAQEDNSE